MLCFELLVPLCFVGVRIFGKLVFVLGGNISTTAQWSYWLCIKNVWISLILMIKLLVWDILIVISYQVIEMKHIEHTTWYCNSAVKLKVYFGKFMDSQIVHSLTFFLIWFLFLNTQIQNHHYKMSLLFYFTKVPCFCLGSEILFLLSIANSMDPHRF